MANREQTALLLKGFEVWNAWRRQNPEVRVDLIQADLPGCDLFRMNLREANLTEANLRKARLERAVLNEATLYKANLSEVNLTNAFLSRATLVKSLLVNSDLSGAALGGANLFEADLEGSILKNARLSGAYLRSTNLRKSDLTGSNLEGAVIVDTDLRESVLDGCRIHGVSVWSPQLEDARQADLIITRRNEPKITVDDIEVAQFIHLLLDNKKLRKVIDTVTSKAVLIFGRFTAERKPALDAIRNQVRSYGLLPIMFDFEPPNSRDTQETITTLAGLSCFIIADITDPRSVPQELGAIVPTLPSVAVQPILKSGNEPWGMFDHIKKYPWVLDLIQYESVDQLSVSLKAIIETVLRKREELIRPRS